MPLRESKYIFSSTELHNARCFLILPLLLLFAGLLGFRASQWGSDTAGYMQLFGIVSNHPNFSLHYEWLFTACMKWIGRISGSPGYFFSFIILLNITMLTLNASVLDRYLWRTNDHFLFIVLLYLVSFISPFFISAQINIIRQGAAVSFIILFYLLLLDKRSIGWIGLSAFLAQGFHSSSILFMLPAFGLLFSYKNVVRLVTALVISYALWIIPFTTQWISLKTGIPIYQKIMSYGADTTYASGIRYKFLFFTIGLGFFFDTLVRYSRNSGIKTRFLGVLKIYWLLTIPFWLFGYGAFSDRLLFPCWSYLPCLSAVVLKAIDEELKPSILWWITALYIVILFYFIYSQLLIIG